MSLRPITRLAVPLARHYCNRDPTVPYKTEATHSGMNLAETTPSLRIDQKASLIDTSVTHSVYNERRVRERLQGLGGGSVDLQIDEMTKIARISISNPGKGNALSGKMMVDLSDIVKELESWHDGKGLVLHGDQEGMHFCSGGDISVLSNMSSPQEGGMMCLYMQNTLGRLGRLPLISVAVVNGKAIGGGAELMTGCDFRLMLDDARVQFKQADMGLTPGWGGGSRLVRIVGPQKGLKLLAGTQTLSALDAVRMGLADELLPVTGNFVQNAIEWLEQYTKASVEVVQGIKNLTHAAAHLRLDKALKVEREIFTGLWGSPEHLAQFAQTQVDLKSKKK